MQGRPGYGVSSSQSNYTGGLQPNHLCDLNTQKLRNAQHRVLVHFDLKSYCYSITPLWGWTAEFDVLNYSYYLSLALVTHFRMEEDFSCLYGSKIHWSPVGCTSSTVVLPVLLENVWTTGLRNTSMNLTDFWLFSTMHRFLQLFAWPRTGFEAPTTLHSTATSRALWSKPNLWCNPFS